MKEIVITFCIEDFSFSIYPIDYWLECEVPRYYDSLMDSYGNEEEVNNMSEEEIVHTYWEGQLLYIRVPEENTYAVAYDVADACLMNFTKDGWEDFIEELRGYLEDAEDYTDDEVIEAYYGDEFFCEIVEK
jgi:hypothetical protein